MEMLWRCLVAVRETTHPRHNAEDVIVHGVDIHTDAVIGSRGSIHLQLSVVNSREVAGSRRLVLFGFESERVDIDFSGEQGGGSFHWVMTWVYR